MDEMLKVAEVAERLRVDPRTIRRGVDREEIPCFRVGRTIRIPRAWLESVTGGEKGSE